MFQLEGPAEAAFLSRVLQIVQLRNCSLSSFTCAQSADGFAVSMIVENPEGSRPDVLAALLRRIIGLTALRWHVETVAARAAANG